MITGDTPAEAMRKRRLAAAVAAAKDASQSDTPAEAMRKRREAGKLSSTMATPQLAMAAEELPVEKSKKEKIREMKAKLGVSSKPSAGSVEVQYLRKTAGNQGSHYLQRWEGIETERTLQGYTPEAPFLASITGARWLSANHQEHDRRVLHLELGLPEVPSSSLFVIVIFIIIILIIIIIINIILLIIPVIYVLLFLFLFLFLITHKHLTHRTHKR
jgi:hypothetical protein